MTLLDLRIFATLVVFLALTNTAFAAKKNVKPDTNPEQKSYYKKSEQKNTEPFAITPAPKIKKRHKEESTIFYPYKKSFSFHSGIYYDQKNNGAEFKDDLFYLFSFQYMLDSRHPRHLEVGADITANDKSYLHFGMKWYNSSHAPTRYFCKSGLSIRWDNNDNLGNFVDWQSYQIRFGVGLEKLFSDPMNWRVDLEGQVGKNDISAILMLGLSFGI